MKRSYKRKRTCNSTKRRSTNKEPRVSFHKTKSIKEYNPTLGRSLNLKWIDMAAGPSSIDTVGTGWSLQLDNVALGTAHNQRNGSKLKIEYIDLRAEVYIPTGGDTTNTMRIILFQVTSAAVPTVATVLQNDALGGGGYNVVSTYSDLQSQKYVILRDKSVAMTTNGYNCQTFHWKISKGFNKDISFNDTIGTPNFNQGAIFMVAVSDSAVVTHPIINWSSRVYFQDA